MHFASKPSYSTLLTGIDPAQTGKITTTLSSKGIGYQIQNDGTALAVQSEQDGRRGSRSPQPACSASAARSPASSCSNSSQLGASNFQQQVTYQRALEGQLDQTIEQIQGVELRAGPARAAQPAGPAVRRQLAVRPAPPCCCPTPARSTRARSRASPSSSPPASRACSPKGDDHRLHRRRCCGRTPRLGRVGGDADLPAVGRQRSTTRPTAAAVDAACSLRRSARARLEVVVNANLNANQATSDTLDLRQEGRAADRADPDRDAQGRQRRRHRRHHRQRSRHYAASTGSSASNYSNKTTNTTYGVDKTVTHAVIAPGAVNNQTVSVLVDKSVPASALPAIRSAVAGAVGLNAKRGDTLVGLADRVRQADRRRRPRRSSNEDARLRQVRADRPRRPDLPVLHAPQHQAPREASRSPASPPGCASSRPRGRSRSLRLGRRAADRRQALLRSRSTSPSARSRSWSSATPIASPSRSAPG